MTYTPSDKAPARSHPKFPVLAIAVAIGCTLVLLSLLARNGFLVARQIQVDMTVNSAIDNSKADIQLYDEILTMSALMAAATGDKVWADRYLDTVPKLDKAMADAGRFSTPAIQDELERSTGAANKQLIDLETKAFELVAEQRLPDALEVLRGDVYLKQKAIYIKGLKDYDALLDGLKVAKVTAMLDRSWRDVAFLSFGSLMIMGAWVFLIRTLLSWKVNLIRDGQTRTDAELRQTETMAQERQSLARDAENRRKTELMAMATALETGVNGLIHSVSSSAAKLSQTAQAMMVSMDQTSIVTSRADSATNDTLANVQIVAAASEELSASVREISGQLRGASGLVEDSRNKVDNAGSLANALNVASEKVAGVTDIIASISGQINLLALNATIEAARAGTAGLGFAVVAGEVKNLAQQTDKSVADIHIIIGDMRAASHSIISALDDIKTSVDSITEATVAVSSAVNQQSSVTVEIAHSMHTAASGTQTISTNLGLVTTSAQRSGEVAREILHASEELDGFATALLSQVGTFVKNIKAA